MSTLGLTCANIDILNESGIAVGHYLRRMTPRLDLGAELVYQYGKQVPGGQATILSYGGRCFNCFFVFVSWFKLSIYWSFFKLLKVHFYFSDILQINIQHRPLSVMVVCTCVTITNKLRILRLVLSLKVTSVLKKQLQHLHIK